jgi:pimeloyl-ACP methyl ester carboxylesterase
MKHSFTTARRLCLCILITISYVFTRDLYQSRVPAPIAHAMVAQSAIAAPQSQGTAPCLPNTGRGDECIPARVLVRCSEPTVIDECPTWRFTLSITATLDERKPGTYEGADWFPSLETSPEIDQYKFGDEPGGSPRNFTIRMRRFYSPLLSEAGVLNSQGIFADAGAWLKLKDSGVLPEFATLYVNLYDVDHPAPSGCDEKLSLRVNGYPVNIVGETDGFAHGLDNQWTTVEARVSTQFLRYSSQPGNLVFGIPPAAIDQEISVVQNAECNSLRAFAVGSGVLHIPQTTRPTFFVHGWSANHETFDGLAAYLTSNWGLDTDYGQIGNDEDGGGFNQNNRGFRSLDFGARELGAAVENFRISRGIAYPDGYVNLVAHSRGGLISRKALDAEYIPRGIVSTLYTLATPHHGVSPGILEGLRWLATPSTNTSIGMVGVDAAAMLAMWNGLCGKSTTPIDCVLSADYLITDKVVDSMNYRGCSYDRGPIWHSPFDQSRIYGYRRVDLNYWNCKGLKSVPGSATNYIHAATEVVDLDVFFNTIFLAGLSIGDGLVDKRSALYPWESDRVPFPTTRNTGNVDGRSYFYPGGTHSNIYDNPVVMAKVKTVICPSCSGALARVTPQEGNAPKMAAPFSQGAPVTTTLGVVDATEIVGASSFSLSVGSSTAITFPVESGASLAMFQMHATNPVSVVLTSPSGTVVTSQTVPSNQYAYAGHDGIFLSSSGVTHYYMFATPESGVWQIDVSAPVTESVGLIMNRVNSPVALVVRQSKGFG